MSWGWLVGCSQIWPKESFFEIFILGGSGEQPGAVEQNTICFNFLCPSQYISLHHLYNLQQQTKPGEAGDQGKDSASGDVNSDQLQEFILCFQLCLEHVQESAALSFNSN